MLQLGLGFSGVCWWPLTPAFLQIETKISKNIIEGPVVLYISVIAYTYQILRTIYRTTYSSENYHRLPDCLESQKVCPMSNSSQASMYAGIISGTSGSKVFASLGAAACLDDSSASLAPATYLNLDAASPIFSPLRSLGSLWPGRILRAALCGLADFVFATLFWSTTMCSGFPGSKLSEAWPRSGGEATLYSSHIRLRHSWSGAL